MIRAVATYLGISTGLAWAGAAALTVAALLGGVAGYKTGHAFGYSAGVEDGEDAQRAKQGAADAEHINEVERKVRDAIHGALDNQGAGPDPDAVDRILRELLGPDATE